MAGATGSDALAARWPEVVRALPAGWQRGVEKVTPVSARVWRIQLVGGSTLALKVGAARQPAPAEAGLLALLTRRGCPTPRVLASGGRDPGWLATEWCGDPTLDDVAPDGQAWAGALVDAVIAVERALAPLGEAGDRHRAFLREAALPWVTAAPVALEWLVERRLLPDELAALEQACALALDSRPGLGSLDYNARNVVIGHLGLRLIDFPSVGFDWTERRLCQYGTATRSRFACVLDVRAVARFARAMAPESLASQESVAQRVDAHAVLLLATAAAQLRLVAKGQAHSSRQEAWKDVEDRREQLRAMLRLPLAMTGPAAALRRRLGYVEAGRVEAWP